VTLQSVDLAVIGGGIMGLAVADTFLAAQPGAKVAVIDKEPHLAAHASGRNSGVIHAGFYYAPESLKARLTRRGNILMHDFCDEQGLRIRRTGKLVVATHESQLSALDTLRDRGLSNGVPLELIDEAQARELEPRVYTTVRALWSPTTSVGDPRAVVTALATRVHARGGRVELGSEVRAGSAGWIDVAQGGSTERLAAGHIVACAGLRAIDVARWFGFGTDFAMLPFAGRYRYLDVPPGWLQRQIYPVPDPRNPFLGVHLTLTADGRIKLGPTATPVLWGEAYGGLRGFSAREAWGTVRHYPRLWAGGHHDLSALAAAEMPRLCSSGLLREAARLVPSVAGCRLAERAPTGVRAQVLHIPTGRLEMDFVVEGDDRSTHLINGVSPGWTSSFAVADHVVGRILGVGRQP
jgi:L-2-hydroxyglutarate oxidase LhgO